MVRMLNNVAGFCESLEDLNKLGEGGGEWGEIKRRRKEKETERFLRA